MVRWVWFRKGACENCGAMTQEKGLFGGRWVWFRKGACENCGAMTQEKRLFGGRCRPLNSHDLVV